MNILGIGPVEFVLIFMIAMVIAGPKRMLQWAYLMGKYMARLRGMWREMMAGLQQEIDAAGVEMQLPKDIPTRADLNRMIDNTMKPVKAPMQQALDELKAEEKRVRDATTIESVRLTLNGNTTVRAPAASQARTDDPPTTTSGFGTWSNTSSTDSSKGEE